MDIVLQLTFIFNAMFIKKKKKSREQFHSQMYLHI